jgi:hypothetical protein
MNMNMNIFKINKVKIFWTCILLVIFLGYTYFYTYDSQEGLTVPGLDTTNSVKRDMRIKAETINDSYGLESINHSLTKLQYS